VTSVPPPTFSHPGPPPLHPELPDGIARTPAPAGKWRGGLAAVPIWVPFAAMLAVFVVASIGSLLVVGIVELAGTRVSTDSLPPGVLLSGTLIQDVALVAGAFVFARVWAGPVQFSTFGLRPTALWPAVGWAALIYAGFWVFAAIYAVVVGQGAEQELVTDLKQQDSLVVLGGFAVLVGIVAPIVEEFFFRGFLFGVLREKLGVVWAALLAGSVFGLIHVAGTPLRTLGILVVLGVGLCLLYARTGSLLPGIGLHSLHNSISFGATKGLVWWGFLLLVVSSVTLVLLVASVVMTRERRLE
jgi:membrane protease YdiL (CAAX protease family)